MNTSETPIVLYIEKPILEADSRTGMHTNTMGTANRGPHGFYGAYDWKVWDGTGYGQRLQREANPGGKGFSIDVHDCGQQISCTAHYQSPGSGKKVSQSFIIVLNRPDRGDGTVFMTSTKWRTVSSISQAASYINSTIRSLASIADQK